MANSKMAKVTRTKILSQEMLNMQYGRSNSHCSEVKSKDKVFKKWVKCQGQGHRETRKGLITRKTNVKYQSFSTHCSKVISKVKFFKNFLKMGQTPSSRSQGTHGKVLSQGILM